MNDATKIAAKDFLAARSEIARHVDHGLRHSFISSIFAAVNEDAKLNDLQQNFAVQLIELQYGEVCILSELKKYRAIAAIATYINSCH